MERVEFFTFGFLYLEKIEHMWAGPKKLFASPRAAQNFLSLFYMRVNNFSWLTRS